MTQFHLFSQDSVRLSNIIVKPTIKFTLSHVARLGNLASRGNTHLVLAQETNGFLCYKDAHLF